MKTVQRGGYAVRETDPFATRLIIALSGGVQSSYGNRIKLAWRAMRDKGLPSFSTSARLPGDKHACLQAVEKISCYRRLPFIIPDAHSIEKRSCK
ncbi:hypothetical protein Q4E93_03665 [Flavitalea sp. BT771]|uniref:hypothetical protein n=1 Tax=Flavitalea sp. BT771 TaxID=3063329 RepID=UPI0026E1DB00|nr:hypothetical protein [Flavitalea sp. BT771]MDO6429668.1 hypothetical protein [Flavitalea sp. BT771]MDV6218204.1 hypothetical protein [Flavitalea sp. BT771]